MSTDKLPVDQTVPSPDNVLDLLEAFRRSKVMFAAVSLGVFDALRNGPMSAGELASNLSCDCESMSRLLNACVGLSLLRKTNDKFTNTESASTYLTSDSPRRMTGYIEYSNSVMWKMWGNLEDAIREGTHRWKQTYGWDEPIFSSFFKDDAAKREFLMGMNGFGMITSPVIVNAIDLSGFRKLVDLGGATGHWAIAACQRWPQLKAIVFDLTTAIPLADEMIAASSVSDRIETIGGDFFETPLPSGDLYSLGRILHDWEEPKCILLLGRIFDALPSGGAVMIGEKILNEAMDGPRWALMQDLNMLVVTEGKERSLSQYSELLQSIGFRKIIASRTDKPLDVILAYKP